MGVKYSAASLSLSRAYVRMCGQSALTQCWITNGAVFSGRRRRRTAQMKGRFQKTHMRWILYYINSFHFDGAKRSSQRRLSRINIDQKYIMLAHRSELCHGSANICINYRGEKYNARGSML